MSHGRRGKGTRPLLEHEIRAAQSMAESAAHAAKLLGVSYTTYKKWAREHDVHDFFNVAGKGNKKPHGDPKKGKYPLDDILAGMYPDYSTDRFKKKLFDSGYKEMRCENPGCDFCEKRMSDDRSPLLIDYIDDNVANKALNNIRILCYNCTFLVGRGHITRGKNLIHNPDKLQSNIGRYKKPTKVEISGSVEPELEIDENDLSPEEIKQLEELSND